MTANVDAIERELTDEEVIPVREWCTVAGVDRDAWPTRREWYGLLDVAVDRACDRALRTRRARSGTHALRLVCGDFGLAFDATQRRRTRQARPGTQTRRRRRILRTFRPPRA